MADDKLSRFGPPPVDQAASIQPIERGLIQRIVDGIRNVVSPQRPSAVGPQGVPNQEPWFGPGRPQEPIAPKEDVAGRAFDFPVGINTYARPRRLEPVTFEQLRALAYNYDLVRLCVETRKDQLAKLEWSILPKKRPDENFRRRADDRCREIEAFFKKPDRIHHWPQWVRMLAEDDMVLGAPCLYLRNDDKGRPWAAEVVEGGSVMPLLDGTGRRPQPPDPAYAQILKGVVAAHYTTDEMLYFPRNPRADKVYGLGIVEQIMMTVNIGLRRMTTQLGAFTEGNVPDALIAVPEKWTVQQIREYQQYFDGLLETPSARRKIKFVPGGMLYQPTRGEGQGLMDSFDEWLARVVCYAFSLPPLPFVRMQNRSTAQTSYETALEEGLAPSMLWLKNAIDDMTGSWFGYPDIELVWDNIRKMDPADQIGQNLQLMQRGIKSLDEIRAEMGLEPLGLGHVMFGIGPMGFMSVQDMARTIKMGLTMPQPPMMAPEGIDPSTGQPIPGQPPISPQQDLLQGVPPELLREVGLNEEGGLVEDDGEPGPHEEQALGDDPEVDPYAAPGVADVLKDAEYRLGAR